jgi:hypothetical protein
MALPRTPLPVKLFTGLLSADRELLEACTARLTDLYGPVSRKSAVTAWGHSSYYLEEMGPGLLRQFVVFSPMIDPGALPAIKNETIGLERSWSISGPSNARRRINIDPGYLTEAKVVLATTKDFPQRVYIGDGIYAEVALHYSREHRSYRPLPHTYPDLRTPEVMDLFADARNELRDGMKAGSGGTPGRL